MKTPSEIRAKSFEKKFRGYDKDEVDAFLASVSDDMENLIKENRDLQHKLDHSEKEGAKLKQVEDSLFKTLKTAEDTGASIIEEANQAADQVLQEAHESAEGMLNEAKSKSQYLLESAESKGKEMMESIKEDVIKLLKGYESLIQQRDLVMKNLNNISKDILDNLQSSQSNFTKIKADAYTQLLEEWEKKGAVYYTIASEPANTDSNLSTASSEIGQNTDAENSRKAKEVEPKELAPEQFSEETAELAQDESDSFSYSTDSSKNEDEDKSKKDGSFFDTLD